MKHSKKIIVAQLLVMVIAMLFFAVPAWAADCTCGKSSRLHDSSHNAEYISNGSSGHKKVCLTCKWNGHSESCAQVVLSKNETHSLSFSGTGANRVGQCTLCGYKSDPCTHSRAIYRVINNTVGGTHTDSTTCLKYCDDCKLIVGSKSHAWGYQQYEKAYNKHLTRHKMICKDCGYLYTGDYDTHTWKYTSYKKPSVPSNPVTPVQSNTSAALDHTAYAVCTGCGFKTSFTQRHTFKNNVCTKCKLAKEILPKVSKLKGKQKGKSKHKVSTLRAQWVWTGNSWKYYKSRKVTTHTYKVTLKWKKNSKAYGYYCSLDKPNTMKSGSYVTNHQIPKWNASNGRDIPTKKNSATLTTSSTKKLSKVTVYIAPISKYGFVGKWQKVTVKVK